MATIWHNRISQAEKYFKKKYWDVGDRIVKKYKDKRELSDSDEHHINIFAANVDSLTDAMYAKPPKVDVSRRFKDADDDLSRVAGIILERTLQQDLEELKNPFHDVVANCLFDRLVPGAGVAWLRVEQESDEGEMEVLIDYVHWKDFLWSPCRTWNERTWIARKVYMTKEEGVARFGKIFNIVPLDQKKEEKIPDDENSGSEDQQATIYEIWDRETKKIIWISRSYKEKPLDEKEDFLQLEDFEPVPRPFFARTTTDELIPIADWTKAQDQYEELNIINQRLSLLHRAVKVVGVYDASAVGIQRMFNEGFDNDLIPVDNWAMFAEKGGLKGQIDWVPIEHITAAIIQLTDAFERKKQHIYEITGISDIVRGATKASETAAAQRLKANFASVKQQKLQGELERFVCDMMTIKAEILIKHFPIQYFIDASNILLTPDAQFALPAIQFLKQNKALEYKIAIEPESMAQMDYASEKQDRMELLTAVGGYIEKAAPYASSPDTLMLLLSMLKFGVAGFRAGKEFEGVLDNAINKMQQQMLQQQQNPPPPPPPSPEEIKANAAVQKIQADIQLESQKIQAESQFKMEELAIKKEVEKAQILIKVEELKIAQVELQIKQAELELEKLKLGFEPPSKQVELQQNDRKLTLEEQRLIADTTLKKQTLEHQKELEHRKIDSQEAQKQLDLQRKDRELDISEKEPLVQASLEPQEEKQNSKEESLAPILENQTSILEELAKTLKEQGNHRKEILTLAKKLADSDE